MLNGMKKIVSLMICTALLCTLMIVPASATTVGNIDYILYEDYDGEGTAKAFDGDNSDVYDFGGRHGKVLKLSSSSTENLINTAAASYTGGTDDAVNPVVFSFDFYVENTATPVVVSGKNNADNNADEVFYIKLQNGTMYAGADSKQAANNTVVYSEGSWNNVTVYRRWNSVGHAHVFLNGKQLGMTGSATNGITGIEVSTLANSANANAYIDDVKLFKTDKSGDGTFMTFEAEAYHDGQYIYVETSFPNNDATVVPATGFNRFDGTKVYDSYTGDEITCTQVSQTGNQLILKPSVALDAGKAYKVDLPETTLKGFFHQRSLIEDEIYFTAEPGYVNVYANEPCTSADSVNSFVLSNEATTTIGHNSAEGAVAVVNSSVSNVNEVTYSTNTASTKARYLDASIDFKVTEKNYYGQIYFHYWNGLRLAYTINSQGKLIVTLGNTGAGDGSTSVIANLTYNVGEWNTVGIRYDKTDNTFTALVNGKKYYISDESQNIASVADAFKIFYMPNKTAGGETILFDNVYIANSATGVADVKVGTNGIWTKDKISASATEATVTFTDEVAAADITAENIKITDADDKNVVASVTPILASEEATTAAQAKITLNNLVLSGREYTVSVSGITDNLGKTIASYTGKFTTKNLAISNLEIVNGDGTPIETTPASVKVKASVDGRTNGVIFIAQYNNGELTGISSVSTRELSGNVETEQYTINSADGELVLRAFIWKDAIDSLKPLCDSVTYPNN